MQRSSVAKTSGLLGALACTLLVSCKGQLPAHEVTPDGLERVASRPSGGVFRAPGAPFDQYKRLIVEPVTIEFKKGWDEQNRDVSERELQRLRSDTVKNFRDELIAVLVDEGPYTFADEPASDVLLVSPRITELDIPGPNLDLGDKRTLTTRSVGMRITGDLRDAATGKLVGRVDLYDGGDEYGMGSAQLRESNRITITHEMNESFEKWSRLMREALDVAKTARPQKDLKGPE